MNSSCITVYKCCPSAVCHYRVTVNKRRAFRNTQHKRPKIGNPSKNRKIKPVILHCHLSAATADSAAYILMLKKYLPA